MRVSSPEPAVGVFTSAGTRQGRFQRHFVIGYADPCQNPSAVRFGSSRVRGGVWDRTGRGQLAGSRTGDGDADQAPEDHFNPLHRNDLQDPPLSVGASAPAPVRKPEARRSLSRPDAGHPLQGAGISHAEKNVVQLAIASGGWSPGRENLGWCGSRGAGTAAALRPGLRCAAGMRGGNSGDGLPVTPAHLGM